MTEIPPSRYRVIERGRRLEVIDTLTGEVATPPRPGMSEPTGADTRPGLLERAVAPRTDKTRDLRVGLGMTGARSGADVTLTTHALYDNKGPRTLRLDADGQAALGRVKIGAVVLAMVLVVLVILMPWVLVVPFFLAFQPKLRSNARTGLTQWFDRFDPGVTGS